MANPLRGSVPLQVSERAYTLSFSVNALCELEAELGAPIAQIAERLNDEKNISMATVRAVVWAGLQDHHPEVDIKGAGLVVTEAGIPPCMEAIGKAFSLAFPEAKGRANPRKAGRSAR